MTSFYTHTHTHTPHTFVSFLTHATHARFAYSLSTRARFTASQTASHTRPPGYAFIS